MSAASANVIQSDGLAGTAQTPSPDEPDELLALRLPSVALSPPRGAFDAAVSSLLSVGFEPLSPVSLVSPLGVSLELVPVSDFEPARVTLLRRSFFAQPEPLK